MKLPKIYEPLTKQKGFVMWDMDEKYGIYYFYYKIKVKKNILRLFLYVFKNETYAGVEYIMDKPKRHDKKEPVIEKYQEVANTILLKRDRVKHLLIHKN